MVKLAIVVTAPSPYRIHQHSRIARELGPEVELWSLFLREFNNQPWSAPLPAEIRPVVFGPGQSIDEKKGFLSWLAEWRKMKRVMRWLQENRVDAVITVGYAHPARMRLIAWCRRAGIPNFLYGDSNVHGDRVRGLRRWLKRLYLGWVVRNITGLMPHSELGRKYWDPYGGKGKPYFFVPQEPDYARVFSVTADERAAVQARYGLRDDRRYFLFSGRLSPVKRIDTLIDAFAKIAGERNDWDLLMVGGGPLEVELRARVPLGLENRVVWTGFIDDADDLAALYTCGDVLVLPSSYEAWSVVVCEAAAAGLPIVASRVVGAAGVLCREGVNGRLFTPGDVPGLADALLEVTASKDRLETLSRGSLEVLDDWRRRADPVQGIHQALALAGVLPPPPPMEVPSPPTPPVAPWRCAAAACKESP